MMLEVGKRRRLAGALLRSLVVDGNVRRTNLMTFVREKSFLCFWTFLLYSSWIG